MPDILSQIWPLAEPILAVLGLCALIGGAFGFVSELMIAFMGDERAKFERRYPRDGD